MVNMGSRFNIYSLELVRDSAKVYEAERTIRSPEDAMLIGTEVLKLQNKTQEHFVILAMNTKNNVIGVHTVHIGSLNSSIVHPRDVYQRLLLNNAASFIAMHNHPSTNPSPSPEDIEVTKRLVEAGKIIGIECLDHIVIGGDRNVSLKEKGYM